MSEFLVVTGMSGAGRSTAADSLEDLGWFVIDNLPAALIQKMAEMVNLPGAEIERVALVIGRGGGARGRSIRGPPRRARGVAEQREPGAGPLPRCE